MFSPSSAPLLDVATVLAISFVSFLIFHKYEPHTIRPVVGLLLVVPTTLGVFSFLIHSELRAIPVTIVSYWLSILFFIFVYRVSPFHPLAKFPGPFLNRISKFVMVKIVSEGRAHLYIQQLHQKYGDVVRVGPNELSYCNVDGVSSILSAQGLLFKGPLYANRTPVPAIILVIHPAAHAKHRRIWAKGFTGPVLDDYDQIAIKRARELVNELHRRRSEIVDLSKWMEYYTFDFMGDLTYNFSFEMMNQGSDAHGYWELLSGMGELSAIVAQVSWAALFIRFVINPGNRGRVLVQLAEKMIATRSKASTIVKDLYHYISNEDGESTDILDRRQVVADGGTAIVAGSGTSSIALTTLWYYLLRSPVHFCRLREEIDTFSRTTRNLWISRDFRKCRSSILV